MRKQKQPLKGVIHNKCSLKSREILEKYQWRSYLEVLLRMNLFKNFAKIKCSLYFHVKIDEQLFSRNVCFSKNLLMLPFHCLVDLNYHLFVSFISLYVGHNDIFQWLLSLESFNYLLNLCKCNFNQMQGYLLSTTNYLASTLKQMFPLVWMHRGIYNEETFLFDLGAFPLNRKWLLLP